MSSEARQAITKGDVDIYPFNTTLKDWFVYGRGFEFRGQGQGQQQGPLPNEIMEIFLFSF